MKNLYNTLKKLFHTDTLRAWGYMDISFLFLYSFMTLLDGGVPFFSTLKILLSITTNYPLTGSAFFILYLAVFSSLFATAILLYQRKPKARYIAYAQTPFRLLMLLPSITPFYLLLAVPLWFFWAPFIVIAISETIKIRSLRRYIRHTNTPIFPTQTVTPPQNPMEF